MSDFIKEFLDNTRFTARGTWRTEESIHLSQIIFDEVINSVIKDINRDLPIKLYLCDTYDTYSQVFSIRTKLTGEEYYLVLDQHMDILNRVFNAIYLMDDDPGHDVWKLTYELLMESSMLEKDNLGACYFGINKIALGEYESRDNWFTEENNFLTLVQMAFITAHEIGHWIVAMSEQKENTDELNLSEDIISTKDNIRGMVEEIFEQYRQKFSEKEYYELILEASLQINDDIIEECTADAIAIAFVIAYVDSFSDEDLCQFGFGDVPPEAVTLKALMLLFMNLQTLAMEKMTVSESAFEIQTSIRLSFFRNYIYLYYEDLKDFSEILEETVIRYEERITNIILEAFSELEDRRNNLTDTLKEQQIMTDNTIFMEF